MCTSHTYIHTHTLNGRQLAPPALAARGFGARASAPAALRLPSKLRPLRVMQRAPQSLRSLGARLQSLWKMCNQFFTPETV